MMYSLSGYKQRDKKELKGNASDSGAILDRMVREGIAEKATSGQSSIFNFLIWHFKCYFKSK